MLKTRSIVAAVVAGSLLVSIPLFAADAAGEAQPTPDSALMRPVSLVVGDMLAIRLDNLIGALQPNYSWTSATEPVVYFDRKTAKIVVEVYGSRTDISDAKSLLDELETKAVEPFLRHVERVERMRYSRDDITLVYLNRASMKEIGRRENGRFSAP